MVSAPDSHMSLEVYLLGKFQIKVNGIFIENHQWLRESAKHLLKLLALEPRHQLHREQIMDLLWADREFENSFNNLNKAIHALRRTLEPNLSKGNNSQFIITQKQQVILASPEHLFIDSDEFEKLAKRAIKNNDLMAAEAALNLYSGDLLPEDIYVDWLTVKRESLRILYRKLATKLSKAYSENQEYDKGIELLRRLSLDDPTDEGVHQNLMQLYVFSGNRNQALKQFEECRKALQELGVEPDEETIELKELIKSGRSSLLRANGKQTNGNNHHPEAISTSQILDTDAKQHRINYPKIRRLTFQQGVIESARFCPDRQTIVYSAAWSGSEYDLYTINQEIGESRSMRMPDSCLYGIAKSGEMAVALDRKFLRGYIKTGTLSRMHFSGSIPRELFEGIQWADWYPKKDCLETLYEEGCLLIVRENKGKSCLEYPVGQVIYETGGWISHPRFSPDGKAIAFIEHPTLADDSGVVSIIALTEGAPRQKQVLSSGWISIQGLAWNGASEEVWFTATREGNSRNIYAVSPNAEAPKERLIYQGIGSLTLNDLSDDGTVLITVNKTRIQISFRSPEDNEERDISWHDWSLARDLSADGKTILFTEAGESGGSLYAAYLRKADNTAALRLGSGSALALSPDGRFALVRLLTTPQQLGVFPTGTGMRKLLLPSAQGPLNYQPWACWFPDGKKILFSANKKDEGTKLYVQELDGEPECLTPHEQGVEISSPHSISPDGKQVAFINSEKKVCLLEIETAKRHLLSGLESDYLIVGWSKDGKYLFVRERSKIPAVIYRYELSTAKKEEWIELMPKDKTGVHEILRVLLAEEAQSYAYSYSRELSDLFVIDNLQ
jgi:DNA-binding SARP family transcriptional activator/Tol biopolymer transport system component